MLWAECKRVKKVRLDPKQITDTGEIFRLPGMMRNGPLLFVLQIRKVHHFGQSSCSAPRLLTVPSGSGHPFRRITRREPALWASVASRRNARNSPWGSRACQRRQTLASGHSFWRLSLRPPGEPSFSLGSQAPRGGYPFSWPHRPRQSARGHTVRIRGQARKKKNTHCSTLEPSRSRSHPSPVIISEVLSAAPLPPALSWPQAFFDDPVLDRSLAHAPACQAKPRMQTKQQAAGTELGVSA